MAVSEQEFTKVKDDLKKAKDDLKKVTDILFGISDDPRFKAKVRKQIIEIKSDNGLPVLTTSNGKRYQVNDVTKLN